MFRGPEHSLIGSVFMVLFGILTGIAAFRRETKLRGAFMHGKGPGVPISPTGRVILFALSLVLMVYGLRSLVH